MLDSAVGIAFQVVAAVVLPPLLDGVRRKLLARIQNRIGPPVLQTWYDILKLVRKPSSVPAGSPKISGFSTILSVIISFTLAVSVPLLVPWLSRVNVILYAHLLVLVAFLIPLAGAVARNPYAKVGMAREMWIFFLAEPALVLAILSLAVSRASWLLWDVSEGCVSLVEIPAVVALLMVCIAESGRVPFDLMEAEQELSGGPMMDFSGKSLAALKLAYLMRLYAILGFASGVLIPKLQSLLLTAVARIAGVFALLVLIALIEALNARFRYREAVLFSFLALIISVIGLVVIISVLG